jgi:AcrR family transcriptional regulator
MTRPSAVKGLERIPMSEASVRPDRPRSTARGEAARSRLLDAALSAFAEKGFHGTGTRDIAEAAGMSPAAVYVHFRTKEDLLYELSLAGHREVHRLVVAAAGSGESPDRRLGDVAFEFAVWHATSNVSARVIQYEFAALEPEHAAEIAWWRRDMEALVRGVIGDGVSAGIFRVADPHITALAVLSLGIDVSRWYRESGAWTPQEIGERYRELVLGMVGAGTLGVD